MQRINLASFPNVSDLPTTPSSWTAACQADGYARVIQDPVAKVRELELGIKNADKVQVGARAFHNLADGRWLTLQPFMNHRVVFQWETLIPNLDLVDGPDKFLTCGIEIKNSTAPNALVQTNITKIGDSFYYWINGPAKSAIIGNTPIPIGLWHTVSMEVYLGLSGSYALTFGSDYLQALGPTAEVNGLAGVAWCMYGNNLATPATYIARFRNLMAYLDN